MFFHFRLKNFILFFVVPVLVVTAIVVVSLNGSHSDQPVKEVSAPIPMKLTLITHYVCGQDVVEVKNDVLSLQDIAQKYPEWAIEKQNPTTNELTLKRNVEELAPECKDAYFGLDKEGRLILFKGDSQNKEVIETFFQIDIESLETELPEEPLRQLNEGIPVHDIAEFNSVLSTFTEFIVD